MKRLLFSTMLLLLLVLPSLSAAAEKWSGVDETVVEKIAKEHGREAKSPLISTEQGDILLFAFLIAGAVGGFAAGYYWKTLLVNRARREDSGRRT